MYMYQRHTTGKLGEDIACNYLINCGYNVIERNFYCKQGEIDIIAIDEKTSELVFVEVKTRKNFSYGKPSEAVNENKQKHIYNSAKYYLYSRNLENEFVRIDVIEVFFKGKEFKINHLKQVI